ncbi:hypothetical protein N9A94_03855 [Akkermansiaceae bacterium]|nr:hypothetical protein [Akkermansiaceae bacterium]MDA7888774.1 hypothetical protein [Akkermansiaceae bacterium]MDB4538215.1 hypothetical protein [Akkermansiaceae bacterium]
MKYASSLSLVLLTTVLALTACSPINDPTTTTPKLSATIPAQFHGTWTHNTSGLHPVGGEEPYVLTADKVQSHETYGDVRSVTILGDAAITVVQDVSSEGTEWTDETHFKLSPDGSRLEIKGSEGAPVTLYRVR